MKAYRTLAELRGYSPKARYKLAQGNDITDPETAAETALFLAIETWLRKETV